MARVSTFMITVALVAGMVGCDYNPPPSQNLEIRDWYDLDAVKNNLDGSYILMNDLDSSTPGYYELASRTANGGKGWEPIGWGGWAWTWFGVKEIGEVFKGSFDGQGYEIRDLYINSEHQVGLFGFVAKGGIITKGGIIKNLTLINATVTAGEAAGGPLGLHEDAVRCLDVAPAAGGVGGLVGYNRGTVSNCYAMANVTGDWSVGGLVGHNEGTVSKCYSTGSVAGTSSVGGLVGDNDEGTVSDSYSISSVSGNSSVGGLVGSHYDATVKKCYSAGSVAGTSSVGSLVGCNDGTVSNSYSTGNMAGLNYLGGLVGWNDGTVSNSYCSGGVTGSYGAGGLVGHNWDTVSNSYSAASVTGEVVGGLVGVNILTVSNSFWDIQTSGQSTSAGGTGKTTAEMQNIATFTGAAWDIYTVNPSQTNPACIWNIVDGETYPFLSWQPVS